MYIHIMLTREMLGTSYTDEAMSKFNLVYLISKKILIGSILRTNCHFFKRNYLEKHTLEIPTISLV